MSMGSSQEYRGKTKYQLSQGGDVGEGQREGAVGREARLNLGSCNAHLA